MKTKKYISIVLCMLMMIPLVPATSYAATGSDFIVTGGSGYTYSADGTLTFISPGDYFVSMTSAGTVTTTDRIAVNGGTAANPVNITLSNVNIDQSSSTTPCAFELQGTSVVNLTLTGNNNLTGGGIYAGLQEPEGTTLTIDGSGSLSAGVPLSDSSLGAGIGGGGDTTGGVLTINGGTVTATGYFGAGIGGGSDTADAGGEGGSGGTITINGGTITAKSSFSAGIGGSDKSDGGTIIISGGTVTAIGGSGSAGIGGGSGGSGGDITVSDGTVTATGGSGPSFGGAGIGGGYGGSGGNITISGGIVTATGGSGIYVGVGAGAGVGSGSEGSGGIVTISGGTVMATGGSEFPSGTGAGIGGSSGLDQGSCVIIGGSVYVNRMGPTPYCNSAKTIPVYLTTVTLGGVTAETEISALAAGLSGTPYSYGVYDVRTDTSGMLYLWLPDGTETTAAQTADGDIYAGSVTTASSSAISGTLSLADLTVTGGTLGTGYTYGANTLCFTEPGSYSVGMRSGVSSTTTDKIAVDGGTAANPINITLNNVNIDQSSSTTPCAFELRDTSVVDLTLTGSNNLTSGGIYAGLQEPEGTTLTIDGSGSLTAGVLQSASSYGAGIGGGGDTTGGALTINGGTVTATGYYGAGIGGGHDTYDAGVAGGSGGSGGTITINDGTVSAKSYSNAGIGGSDGGGIITIGGGTVTATGGNDGAGIGGGGDNGSGGSITISGGSITATGGNGGAGIGGGFYSSGDTISIRGGIVTAIGGSSSLGAGAGIGGGGFGSGGTITISGGIVTATGGNGDGSWKSGAGIGGGYYATGGSVTISGGTVTATGPNTGGLTSVGIGKGYSGQDQGSCVITGGSISVSSMGPTPYCDSAKTIRAYRTTVSLESVATETAISSLTASLNGSAYSYGVNDVQTDTAGALYLWLPDETETTAAQTSANAYAGSVSTATDSAISFGTLYLAASHTITASAGSGGGISPDGAVSVAYGGSQTFTITPDSGYGIYSVSVDSVTVGAVSSYTFSNITADHAISAEFRLSSDGSGGGSGGSSSHTNSNTTISTSSSGGASTVTLTVNAVLNGNGSINVSLTQSLISEAIQKALAEAEESGTDITSFKIVLSGSDAASGLTLTLPSSALGMMADGDISLLQINTPLGDFSFDAETLKLLEKQADGALSISIETVDPATLSEEVQAVIGSRPVYRFTVTIGGAAVSDFGDGTVTVSLPYTPADGEDTDKIVIYYISESGELVIVPNCVYDAKTGTITFTTKHFSTYAIGYHDVTFSDVSGWYENYVQYLAARGVINGTSSGAGEGQGGSSTAKLFSPNANITRAQFVTILANLSRDDLSGYADTSFSDVKATAWYSEAVQWASEKGIAQGSGGAFHPNASIAREQMAVMLYNYAKYAGLNASGVEGMAIREFSDYGSISNWAVTPIQWAMNNGILSGNGGSFSPKADATRAQASKIVALLMQGMIEE